MDFKLQVRDNDFSGYVRRSITYKIVLYIHYIINSLVVKLNSSIDYTELSKERELFQERATTYAVPL